MSEADDYLAIGTVTRSHGLKGEVVVDLVPGARESLEGVERVWYQGEGGLTELRILKIQQVGRSQVFRFEGYKKREVGDTLRGKELLARREDLDIPEGDVPVDDLLGFEVRLEDGTVLGALADVLMTGANDVYVVHGERGEWVLPATDEVVLGLDMEARRITVRLLPGLEPTPTRSQGGGHGA